jgi:hypothetical protein
MAYSRDFGRIFRNMDYWIELKRLLFKLFRITKFRMRDNIELSFFSLSMLSSTAYGRNIIPPHICYSVIVQMIDFLVNCITAPYIIKICSFCQMWANRSICSYSDFNLAYVAEFQYKTGYAIKKNRSVWKLSTHINNSYTAHFVPVSFVYSI